MERVLDYRPRHDPASEAYPVTARLAAVTPKTKEWAGPYVRIDQGREGACVGFGWTDELMSSPHRFRPPGYKSVRVGGVDVANTYALTLYKDAQRADEWPGEDYEGTSVLAGAKVLKARGSLAEYRWARNITEVRDAVVQLGPVVIGIPWYSNMYETRADGTVDTGGELVGGHCICLTGYYPKRGRLGEAYRWRNSWGPTYGINGDGWIAAYDLDRLIFQSVPEMGGPGEACIPTEVV